MEWGRAGEGAEWRRGADPAPAPPPSFSVFLPPSALDAATPAPILIFLSGLTCTDANATEKSGAQRAAAAAGIALAFPDTSPRGETVPDDPDKGWDFGLGAGFYVDATAEPWKDHYRMETYITRDLVAALASIPGLDTTRLAVAGHSMGGHGALTLALKHPSLFRSASALAPICAPAKCPWGVKALTGYLGPDGAGSGGGRAWDGADAARLASSYAGPRRHLLVDVGTADEFLEQQLLPEALEEAVKGRGGWVGGERDGPPPPAAAGAPLSLTLTRRDGYDHSYFFISTFIDAHVAHAAAALLTKEWT